MESFFPGVDPDCTTYCGPNRPYMFYDGDVFCAGDANEVGRWVYVDFSVSGSYVTSPPIYSTCA